MSASYSHFRSIPWCIAMATVCTALSFATVARADDGEDQGGAITGSEEIHEKAPLLPVVSGSAVTTGSGLGGKASINAEDEDGTTDTTIRVCPVGLASGTYTLSATLSTGTDTVVIGTFGVATSGTAQTSGSDQEESDSIARQDDQGDNNQGDDHEGDRHQGDGEENANVVFGGDSGNPIPAGVNPFDIATLVISDTTSTPILSADFTTSGTNASAGLNANIFVTPGVADPNATGHVVLHVATHKGHTRSSLNLNARGLPANTTLALALNGTDVGTVTTDKHGRLHVQTGRGNGHGHRGNNVLPNTADLSNLTTLSVHYVGGQEVLHADL